MSAAAAIGDARPHTDPRRAERLGWVGGERIVAGRTDGKRGEERVEKG